MMAEASTILVDPAWLGEHMEDPNLVIADARNPQEYAAAHLPGAVHLPLAGYQIAETSAEGLAAYARQLGPAVAQAGINHGDTVVVYDMDIGPPAARTFWALEHLGHSNVRVLNGGIQAWYRESRPLSSDPVRRPAGDFEPDPQPERVAGVDEVQAHLEDQGWLILDSRSESEYKGQQVPFGCSRAGRIPGAKWLEWNQLVEPTGRLKDQVDIHAAAEAAGASNEKDLVTYCHVGSRSAHLYLSLRSAGYRKVRNYVGSWNEWGNRADLPIEGG
jgi:thiosulfate/3-mercaptopyruvate sulfurtransferase